MSPFWLQMNQLITSIAFLLFVPSWSSGPPYLSLCSFGPTQSDCLALLQPLPVQVPRPEQGCHDLREDLWADFHLPTLIPVSNFKPDWNRWRFSDKPDWNLTEGNTSDKASPDWNRWAFSDKESPDWDHHGLSTSTSYTMKRASSSQSFGSSDGTPSKKRALIWGSIDISDDETQTPTSSAATSSSQQLFFGWKQTEGDIVTRVMPKPKPQFNLLKCDACNQGFANKSGYNGNLTSKGHLKKVGLLQTQATQLIRCISHYSK